MGLVERFWAAARAFATPLSSPEPQEQPASVPVEEPSILPENRTPELILDRLEPMDFPRIRPERIKHHEFLPKKKEYLQAAYTAVTPFVTFILHLPPISRDEQFERHIEYIIKGFLDHFWDMPSSKSHHDSEPFGHLVHSLRVGCRQAYKMSLHNLTHEHGIDSETTKKLRAYLVMTGFLAGLLHDSNKIFNYDLQAVNMTGKPEVFDPTYGSASILDFTLKHSNIRRGWKQSPKSSIFYGINLFYLIVPRSLRIRMSGEMLDYIFSTLNGVKDTSDHLATKQALSKDENYLKKIAECVHELLLDPQAVNNPDAWAFKVSSQWWMVQFPRFIHLLSSALGAIPESVEQVLADSGVLFVHSSGQKCFKATVYFRRQKEPVQMGIAFLAAGFFEQIWLTIHQIKPGNAALGISEAQREYFQSLGIEPALPKGLFFSRETDKKEHVTKTDEGCQGHQQVEVPTSPKEASNALNSIRKKLSPELFTKADLLAVAILSSIANSFGVTQKTIRNDPHLQKGSDEKTIFYFLSTGNLYARVPQAVSWGWNRFLAEKEAGLHPWADNLNDLPDSWNPNSSVVTRKLTLHFYFVWRGRGFVIPHETTTFSQDNLAVSLVTGFDGAGPKTEQSTISGQFIELDPVALSRLANHRSAKGSFKDAVSFMFQSAYQKPWIWKQ